MPDGSLLKCKAFTSKPILEILWINIIYIYICREADELIVNAERSKEFFGGNDGAEP